MHLGVAAGHDVFAIVRCAGVAPRQYPRLEERRCDRLIGIALLKDDRAAEIVPVEPLLVITLGVTRKAVAVARAEAGRGAARFSVPDVTVHRRIPAPALTVLA